MKTLWAAALIVVAVAGPARADVKAGVEAWGRGDFARAVQEWRGPATAGDADAQFNLGQAYKLGRGVPTDQGIANEWFRKAAVQGHPKAEDNYGLSLFQDGKKAEALPWLEKSVARDEKRAQLVLGTMLFNADGVPRDWTRAYALVTRSSQQGLPQGSQTLAQMDRYIPEAQRREGIELAKKIENNRRVALAGAGAPVGVAPVPPSKVAEDRPKPVRIATVTRRPAPKPVVAAKPLPSKPALAKPGGGQWRVQLGAFREPGNARSLWSQVGGKVGGNADYVVAGGLTKLQATGFGSRAAAQAACRRAGGGCAVVAR